MESKNVKEACLIPATFADRYVEIKHFEHQRAAVDSREKRIHELEAQLKRAEARFDLSKQTGQNKELRGKLKKTTEENSELRQMIQNLQHKLVQWEIMKHLAENPQLVRAAETEIEAKTAKKENEMLRSALDALSQRHTESEQQCMRLRSENNKRIDEAEKHEAALLQTKKLLSSAEDEKTELKNILAQFEDNCEDARQQCQGQLQELLSLRHELGAVKEANQKFEAKLSAAQQDAAKARQTWMEGHRHLETTTAELNKLKSSTELQRSAERQHELQEQFLKQRIAALETALEHSKSEAEELRSSLHTVGEYSEKILSLQTALEDVTRQLTEEKQNSSHFEAQKRTAETALEAAQREKTFAEQQLTHCRAELTSISEQKTLLEVQVKQKLKGIHAERARFIEAETNLKKELLQARDQIEELRISANYHQKLSSVAVQSIREGPKTSSPTDIERKFVENSTNKAARFISRQDLNDIALSPPTPASGIKGGHPSHTKRSQ